MPMRFKVGDKVRIKPFSEIRLDKTDHDPESRVFFAGPMKKLCGTGKTYTVSRKGEISYSLEDDAWNWADAWLESAEEGQKILPGYAVKRYYKSGWEEVYLATRYSFSASGNPVGIIVGESGNWDSAKKKSDVIYGDICKVEVYGYCGIAPSALKFSTADRPLLWTWEADKPAPKKMTVAEICKALGYDVEIVKDGGSDA